MAADKILYDRESDAIAELTRLVAESDRYEDGVDPDMPFRHETFSEGHGEATAPQPAGADGEADGADLAHRNALGIKVPRAAVLVGLALLGTAGAFGHLQLLRGSAVATLPPIIRATNEPNKIAADPAAKISNKDTTGSVEKIVFELRNASPCRPRYRLGTAAHSQAVLQSGRE